ncbi:hypothetical protein KKE78_04550 [Patescibacteria group bacterium]|nr:hypothetical protein [Patescibacteria group bacterium]
MAKESYNHEQDQGRFGETEGKNMSEVPVEHPVASQEGAPEDPAAERREVAIGKVRELDQIRVFTSNLDAQIQSGQALSPEQQTHRQQAEIRRNDLLQNASFEEVLIFSDNIQSPDDLKAVTERRDVLLQKAEAEGLFVDPIARLSGIYYGSRVMVTNDQKEGRGEEYEGRGKLQELERMQRMAYNPQFSLETEQEEELVDARTGARRRTGARIPGFWDDPAHPERKALESELRGVVDYFNQKSTDLILDVVRDRKIYTLQHSTHKEPPKDGIYSLWKGFIRDSVGHALKEEMAEDFSDFREAIEEARRREPWVPNRRDYETYIRYVADDIEELEEMIPYIVEKVRKKLGTGQPDKLSQKLEQEKEKQDGALAAFPERLIESERQFRRLKSTLAANHNLMGAYYFSEKVRDDWGPYLSYLGLLATGTQDTEIQDHLVDSLFLDKEGLTMLALDQFSQEDGIFWRYGEKRDDINTDLSVDMTDLLRWQERRRREIEEFLLNHKLKPMQILLDTHPAFQRLKQKFNELDEQDQKPEKYGYIRDADGEPTEFTRWQEYCEKALLWERTGEFGDPREAGRVIFQHPLARAFKEGEFIDMYEEDVQVKQDRWYESTKRRKVRSAREKAERISRVFMQDSVAALAWHYFDSPEAVDEVNRWLERAGMRQIEFGDTLPHKTLFRAMMKACLAEDKEKDPARRMFKFHYLLTEKLGLDLDIPVYAAWYLGSHDTFRSSITLRYVDKDADPGGLKYVMPDKALGLDEKNTTVRWAENERRMQILMELVVKQHPVLSKYFNFPGHDTPGAGVKDARNLLNPLYGISRDTVWLSGLINAVIFGERDFLQDYGFSKSFVQYVGAVKGSDEVIFRQSGYAGLIESPRDMEAWVKRLAIVVEQQKVYARGDKDGFALLNDGPLSGGYLWRDFDLSNIADKYSGDMTGKEHYAIDTPLRALEYMKEPAYRAGIELAGKVVAPLIRVMKNTVDSTFGKNPGSARFLNTLLWYNVSKWMDTSLEFRSKPGYSIDANLFMARYFMHAYLMEYGNGGLIYSDQEWDEIMLGYVLKQDGTKAVRYEVDGRGNTYEVDGRGRTNILYGEDSKGDIINSNGDTVFTKIAQGNYVDSEGRMIDISKIVVGSIYEGLIDAFPGDLREEIIKGGDLVVLNSDGKEVKRIPRGDFMLPFGLSSNFPETCANYYQEGDQAKKDYKGILEGQISPRKTVTRDKAKPKHTS